MNALRHIRWSSVAIAIFAFYVLPLLPMIVLTSLQGSGPSQDWLNLITYVVLYFLAIAPACSGYLAARLAGTLPLLHGLVVGLIGGLLWCLWTSAPVNPWILPALAIVVTLSGLFGGWLFRFRATSRPA